MLSCHKLFRFALGWGGRGSQGMRPAALRGGWWQLNKTTGPPLSHSCTASFKHRQISELLLSTAIIKKVLLKEQSSFPSLTDHSLLKLSSYWQGRPCTCPLHFTDFRSQACTSLDADDQGRYWQRVGFWGWTNGFVPSSHGIEQVLLWFITGFLRLSTDAVVYH